MPKSIMYKILQKTVKLYEELPKLCRK